ncbi:hypothetical protein [Brucella rhizosphaerae]|uniref:hypothetical protein n=1 Tax=Brucella rhizosphaerae TaxID=571254 RepID=UPI0036175D74
MTLTLRTYAALSLSAALLASTAVLAEPASEIGIKDADYSLEALIEAAGKSRASLLWMRLARS